MALNFYDLSTPFSQSEPEIVSAFYFDLALRTFLAIKSILQKGAWPPSMKYLTCDEYDGTNSPDHTIDLRTEFVAVSFWGVMLRVALRGLFGSKEAQIFCAHNFLFKRETKCREFSVQK